MNALHAVSVPTAPSARVPMVGLLRVVLLVQATVGLGLAVVLSMVARESSADAETPIRFAAGGAFLFAIFAAVASRGARRRRRWAWTMAAMLQVALAMGTGIAVIAAAWHPAYLGSFALGGAVMLVLSSATVRRELGQA